MKQYEQVIDVMRKRGGYATLGYLNQNVDVIWFNERSLPDSFFEVEHSTDFINSFTKFHDLQDFYSKFFILSSHQRRPEFDDKIARSSFKGISDRIRFIDYEFISNLHTKTFELERIGKL